MNKRIFVALLLGAFIFLACGKRNEKVDGKRYEKVDKVYVINLDQSTERLEKIEKNFCKNQLSFERFPAINGSSLNLNQIKEKWKYRINTDVEPTGKELTPGEFGCYLSHVDVLKDFLSDRNMETALIFEDDVRIVDNFNERMSNLLGTIPWNWDILYLGCYYDRFGNRGRKFPVTSDGKFYILNEGMCPGAYAYLVNRAGAGKILSIVSPIEGPIDLVIGHHLLARAAGIPFSAYCAKTSLAEPDFELPSVIDQMGRDSDKQYTNS